MDQLVLGFTATCLPGMMFPPISTCVRTLITIKLGTNLVEFLGNVCDMFEKIAFTLPQYATWFDLCRTHVKEKDKNRLGSALSFVYADMIDFCMHVYRIFSRARHGLTPK
jgi:hypothetical protein